VDHFSRSGKDACKTLNLSHKLVDLPDSFGKDTRKYLIFLIFLCFRQCSGWRHYISRMSLCESQTNIVSKISWVFVGEFYQTFTTNGLWGKDEHVILGVKRSRSRLRGQMCPKMQFLALQLSHVG